MDGNRCTVGMAVLEPDATVGSNVDILSGRHQHGTGRLDVPIQRQAGRFRRVTIGRNAWVGNSAVVMADVGPHCVVGAGSVVARPLPERAVAAGNPAVVKYTREAS
jgi:acetyltransferase-like isoleucine patch superfamily enzyme